MRADGIQTAFSTKLMSVQKQTIELLSLTEKIVGELYLPEKGVACPALIVCHGAGEFKENYTELCGRLASRGIVALAIDMHGHGASEGERFHVNMAEWIADVRSAVEFLSKHPSVGGDRIGAFGLSSGGTAILEAALVEPRLKALVALDATVRTSMPWFAATVLRGLSAFGWLKRTLTRKELRLSMLGMLKDIRMASDPEVDRRLRADPRSTEAFRSFPLPGAAQSFFVDTLSRVSQISIPTMVLWGEEDQVDSPETAQILYNALMCKKQLHIIPGNGHVGHLDRNREQVFSLTANWAIENLAA